MHTIQVLSSKNKDSSVTPEQTHLHRLQTFSAKSLTDLAKYNGSPFEINFPNTADGNDLHLKQQPYLLLMAAAASAGGGAGSNGVSFPTLQSFPEGRLRTHLTCKLANEEHVSQFWNKQA